MLPIEGTGTPWQSWPGIAHLNRETIAGEENGGVGRAVDIRRKNWWAKSKRRHQIRSSVARKTGRPRARGCSMATRHMPASQGTKSRFHWGQNNTSEPCTWGQCQEPSVEVNRQNRGSTPKVATRASLHSVQASAPDGGERGHHSRKGRLLHGSEPCHAANKIHEPSTETISVKVTALRNIRQAFKRARTSGCRKP